MFEIRVILAAGKISSTTTQDKALAKILIDAARNTGCPILVLQDGKIVRQYNNARISEKETVTVQYCAANYNWREKEFESFFEAKAAMAAIERHGFYGRIIIDSKIFSEVNKDLKKFCCKQTLGLPAPTVDLPVKTRRTSIERDGADPVMLEEIHYASGREAWYIAMPEEGLGFNEIKPSEAKFWLKEARQNKELRIKNESRAKAKAMKLQREAEEAYAVVVEVMPEEGGVAHKLLRTIDEVEAFKEVSKDLKKACCKPILCLPAPSVDMTIDVRRYDFGKSWLDEVHYASGREAWFINANGKSIEIRPSQAAELLEKARKTGNLLGKQHRETQARLKAALAVKAQREAEEAYAAIVEAMPSEGGVAHKLLRTINE